MGLTCFTTIIPIASFLNAELRSINWDSCVAENIDEVYTKFTHTLNQTTRQAYT